MRKIFILMLILMLALSLAACDTAQVEKADTTAVEPATELDGDGVDDDYDVSGVVADDIHSKPPMSVYSIGEIISFGDYEWRVLEVQGGKALLLTENVIDIRPYNIGKFHTKSTWESCSIRTWLNSDFYNSFNFAEKERICITKITNGKDLWNYVDTSGNDTQDYIFLLSCEEVDKYFGDSGDYRNGNRKAWDQDTKTYALKDDGDYFSNSFDNERATKLVMNEEQKDAFATRRVQEGSYPSHEAVLHDLDQILLRYDISWWLRQCGGENYYAPIVVDGFGLVTDTGIDSIGEGAVKVGGESANRSNFIGIRPAMWIQID